MLHNEHGAGQTHAADAQDNELEFQTGLESTGPTGRSPYFEAALKKSFQEGTHKVELDQQVIRWALFPLLIFIIRRRSWTKITLKIAPGFNRTIANLHQDKPERPELPTTQSSCAIAFCGITKGIGKVEQSLYMLDPICWIPFQQCSHYMPMWKCVF